MKARSKKASTASRRSKPKAGRRTRAADAITMLKADHEKVSAMFERFERSRQDSVKQDLAARICEELTVHTTLEEEIFYPAVRAAIDEADLMDEALVEHASAKDLIAQIQRGAGDERFDAKVTVLGEYIKHHVKEEQQEMFPKVRKADLDLQELGDRMRQRRQALTRDAG